jgi:hypothetical protein
VSAATLGGLIGTLVAARHAGGYRYDFPERVLRQLAQSRSASAPASRARTSSRV